MTDYEKIKKLFDERGILYRATANEIRLRSSPSFEPNKILAVFRFREDGNFLCVDPPAAR
jgi:uncharacterized protein YqfB (UPF0267 family)